MAGISTVFLHSLLVLSVLAQGSRAWFFPFFDSETDDLTSPTNTTAFSASPTTTTEPPPPLTTKAFARSSHRPLESMECEVCQCILENVHKENIVLQAELTKEYIDEFKEDYVQDKFDWSWDTMDNFPDDFDHTTMEVCSVDQTCARLLPSLLDLPTTPAPPTTPQKAEEILTELRGFMQRYYLALQQLVLDQTLGGDIYQQEMHNVYLGLEVLLEKLDKVGRACEVAADDLTLASSFLDKMYIDTTDPVTDYRGFTTLRQSLKGLNYLLEVFPGVRKNQVM